MSVRREMRGFLVGSLLFALGATPGYLGLVGVTADNLTYFLGSIFFTIAGFTQLRLTGRWQRGGWSDRDAWADWWAAAIQFLGTLAFNVSTLAALLGTIDPGTFERLGWRPDFIGSICFLVASVLAVEATTNRESLWDPEARNWWNTWLNMAGSVAFMISA
ncbi:MAG TPA: YrhK family protein, partial [Solirubrobacterales bacterium]|nr:YrhK family protein [Solirubrobacterales bacterium]